MLRKHRRQADRSERPEQVLTSERKELKRLRRENRELRCVNLILEDRCLYFSGELDQTRRT